MKDLKTVSSIVQLKKVTTHDLKVPICLKDLILKYEEEKELYASSQTNYLHSAY